MSPLERDTVVEADDRKNGGKPGNMDGRRQVRVAGREKGGNPLSESLRWDYTGLFLLTHISVPWHQPSALPLPCHLARKQESNRPQTNCSGIADAIVTDLSGNQGEGDASIGVRFLILKRGMSRQTQFMNIY